MFFTVLFPYEDKFWVMSYGYASGMGGNAFKTYEEAKKWLDGLKHNHSTVDLVANKIKVFSEYTHFKKKPVKTWDYGDLVSGEKK